MLKILFGLSVEYRSFVVAHLENERSNHKGVGAIAKRPLLEPALMPLHLCPYSVKT
jgi:hypothetical protein